MFISFKRMIIIDAINQLFMLILIKIFLITSHCVSIKNKCSQHNRADDNVLSTWREIRHSLDLVVYKHMSQRGICRCASGNSVSE